jgi:CheY-like chemotaxis protein
VAEPFLLIIDSYRGARAALADLLRDSGYVVREASDDVEGLGTARDAPPSMVIVDPWPFPSTGLQMLERLRRKPETAGIPVLVLTSAGSHHYRGEALAAGCESYLHKPSPPDLILSEVARILGKTVRIE